MNETSVLSAGISRYNILGAPEVSRSVSGCEGTVGLSE